MDELTKRTPRRELRYGIKALILSFVMLMIAFPSYARNGNITINVSGVPMQTVLKKIEQQTDYRFFYSKDAVNVNSKVSLNVTNESLTAVLDKLFDSSGISYRINKKKVSHEFAVKGLNFMGTKEHYGHEYNVKTGKIDATDGSTVLTNVSYKLEF